METRQPNPSEIAARHGIDLDFELHRGLTAKSIRSRAKSIVRALKLSRDELQDMEQTLTLALLNRMAKFDPALSPWHAFVIGVLDNEVATLIKQGISPRRGVDEEIVSLQTEVPGEDGMTTNIASTLTAEEGLRRRGIERRPEADHIDLKDAVRHVLSQLSESDRDLCEHLMHGSIFKVARELKLPRRTVRRKVDELREKFVAAGLSEIF